jgi:Mce-associated membrane protein
VTNDPDEKSTAIDETELEKVSLAKAAAVTEAEAAADDPDGADAEVTDPGNESGTPPTARKRTDWAKVFAYGVLPALALILALGAGWLKYVDNSASNDATSRIESIQAAKDITITLLSYQPDKVEQQLNDARSLLTGSFRDEYTGLINEVVIPGAKQNKISAVATVPRAASVSADSKHATVLVMVNQTVVVGGDAPTATASSLRVKLEKVDGKWLISKFDPV